MGFRSRVREAGRIMGGGLVMGGLCMLLVLQLDLTAVVSYWGDRTILVPVAAMLGAILWRTRLRLALVSVTGCLALLWLVVAFTPLTRWMADGLPRTDRIVKCDAIFVFGSRVQADHEPTAHAMSRLVRGIELLAQGQAAHLVVSEIRTGGRHEILARRMLESLGVKGELHVVGPIRNTRDEAVAVARLSRSRGWTRILSVTSPTHSRRAALALEREGLLVVSVPALETLFDLEALDRREDRLEALGALLHERVGLVWYRLRGHVRSPRPAAAVSRGTAL